MSISEKMLSQVRSTQQAHLLQVLNNEKLSDITFIIGKAKKRFRINRIFLAVISPVFEAMLCGDTKTNSAEIIIDDIDPNAFDCIIKYAYFNDPGLNSDNIASVKYLCDKYQIKTLSKHILEIAASKINNSNEFLVSFENAVKYKYDDLINVHLDHIKGLQVSTSHKGWNTNNYTYTYPRRQFCEQLINSEQFLHLSQAAIQSLLSLNEFAMKEDLIWTRLMKWAEYDDDQKNDEVKKMSLLKSVKTCVRFGLMTNDFFARNVATQNVLDQQEMLHIFMYIGAKKDNGCGNFCTEPRKG